MSNEFQPNTLQKLQVGQPLRISASTWNTIVKHVEHGHESNDVPYKSNESNTLIICKNESGVDILPFFCVKLTSPNLASAGSFAANSYNATPVIIGGAYPMPREEDFLGITQERINNGECGYVLIHGITPLRYGNMFVAPSYAEEQANTYYLSPDIYMPSAYPIFTCTTVPAKIRLLKYHTDSSNTTQYPLVFIDNGVNYPKPYFGYTKTVASNHVSLTFDSFECDIFDVNDGQFYSKTVPQITVSNIDTLWATHKYIEYLVYNKATDTFNIYASISSDDFFCPIGFQDHMRFVNTCFHRPVLFPNPSRQNTVDSPAFNITYSASKGTISISSGTALIIGAGISKSWSSTSLSVDSAGNAFVAGSKYHIYAEYDLTTGTFSVKARKDASSNRRLTPSSDTSYSLIGDVVFGVYKHQMFKGSFLPMFLDLNMRNPT